MHLEKLNNLTELKLNLENNNITNEGLREIIAWIDSLDNLIKSSLDM